MAKYIELDALVAEIERLREEKGTFYASDVLYNLKDFINTLEVKEVDLEKELSYEDYIRFFKEHPNFSEDWGFDEAWVFAKYFFELGLKAQKDNIRHSMDEPPKYPCDILLVTDVDNMFLCRYMENGRPVDRETPYFRGIENGKCWYYCNDIMNIH